MKRRWCSFELLVLLACTGCYEAHSDVEVRDPPKARHSSTAAPLPWVNPDASDAPDPALRLDAGSLDAGSLDAGDLDAGADAARPDAATEPALIEPDPNLRVAFLGDQGLGSGAHAVLQLIADERADAVVHAGDLGYVTGESSVEAWAAQVDAVLGASFPYFVAIGNHDVTDWSRSGGYRDVLLERLAGIAGASCDGEYGVNALCRYRGLAFVLSGVGTFGEDHEAFLDAALSDRDTVWRLCIWHKNQHDMQVGAKPDEVGWDAYRTCAAHGVPIITAHEHSYARTPALLDVGNREAGHGAAFGPFDVALEPGRTMVVVTGLGGHSARAFTEDHASDTWWASIYAGGLQLHNRVVAGTEPAIAPGALFVDFHVDGDPHKARGYFKTVSGELADDFELSTQ